MIALFWHETKKKNIKHEDNTRARRSNSQLDNSKHTPCLIAKYSDQVLSGSATHTEEVAVLSIDLDLYNLQ